MRQGLGNKAIIVCGPTAAGKTGLAIAIAEAFDGVVINADSKQIYEGLPILTAQPTAAQQARVPHRLYGVVPPESVCSAGDWRALAIAECHAAWHAGRIPVVVGGTGLYLRALTRGLSPVPAIPDDIRAASRALLADLGNAAFHTQLSARDPLMGARLAPGNSQRLARAWEVLAATGRSLADWQAEPPRDALEADILTLAVMPPRPLLYAACDGRFTAMLEAGAEAEARDILARNLDPALPAMSTLGLPQLAAYVSGNISRAEAVAAAQQATRHYAKRQMTWFRHQAELDRIIATQLSKSIIEEIFSFIRQFLLTDEV